MGKFYARLGEELSLYVKQMAWLNTTPRDDSKSLSGNVKAKRTKSRAQAMKDDGLQPEYPPIWTPHLIEYLTEVGPVVPGGMSMVPISWRDLTAWQENTGIVLEAWEARLLRRLSHDYLAQTVEAENPDCPSPFTTRSPVEFNREAVARKAAALFGGMAQRQRERSAAK